MGSTREARMAGIRLAANATARNNSATVPKTIGSVALTWNRNSFNMRVSANAPATPMLTPASAIAKL